MILEQELKNILEKEEKETVSDSFGGTRTQGKTKSYSVTKIRNWLIENLESADDSDLKKEVIQAKEVLSDRLFRISILNLIRFSFLIELTNLKVGSTKMKTRWLPGFILMPQDGSFEPIRGSFEPQNDPRASSFQECLEVFVSCLNTLCAKIQKDAELEHNLLKLSNNTSVPYEFVFDYVDPKETPVHIKQNIAWVYNEDIGWLSESRPIIWPALSRQQISKIQTKTYKTDRALTGKDKTNRAKRWEVLSGDFQHASLTQCWSVEKRLLEDMIGFEGFSEEVKEELFSRKLMPKLSDVTRCPVTLEPLSFAILQNASVHGRSDYQVGHLHPLKKGGKHQGDNICWQSSDGNRIQGDLMIEETTALLKKIFQRMQEVST